MAFKFNPFTSNLDIVSTSADEVYYTVKNDSGSIIYKGEAVYVSGANGTNVLVKKAKADAESTSSQTLGLAKTDIAINGTGKIVGTGKITGFDTTASSAAGDAVYLSGTTAGGLVYGLANKPSAPTHLVYIGTVTRRNANNGEIFIRVSNGWELKEIHDVSAQSPSDGQVLTYESSTSLWKPKTSSGSGGTLTEYLNSDKPSPSAGDVWVKHTAPTGAGSPIGLLLALTTTGSGVEKYELSYRTSAGTTKRIELT